MSRSRLVLIATLALAGMLPRAPRAQQDAGSGQALDPALLKSFQWRSIGPLRGGRSIAIAGVKGRPGEGYFGATGGGLWKTTDGGDTWTPVTDGQIHSSSVGAVAVSESNPDVVFIGTGEQCIRGNIQPGDGVYKSTDAGKTWAHVGLAEAQNISRIRVHPANPDTVFVAAFGHYGARNRERGLYKTTDGGRTWKQTLYRDDRTGAVDIAIDRRNPDVMYAALWEAYRVEYQMSSGGPGSGLFKSTDGGETWKEITRNPGLPTTVVGKIGVAVSGADSNRVYAIVEAEKGGLFASDDAGATWTLTNDGRNIRQRAFYYTHVAADPNNKDVVYALNVGTFRSTDGGKTMTSFAGGDSHDLWIDPDDSNHVLHASDSGGAVTFNAGSPQRRWTERDYATGQFYHTAITRHIPYHVCGAQQDSSTICVPSDTNFAGRGGRGAGRGGVPPTYTAGGSEPGYIAPDPTDPDVFFAGGNNGSFLTRLNRRTGQLREVGPYPRMFSGESSSALVERWQWTYPIVFSPVNPSVLYASSQHVWKTTNGGQSWEKISGDLTRHDPKTLGESGGPITHDMNGPEVYATVFALGPGKQDVDVVWAGSDDGLVHVTRDGGRAWTDVTPKEMPELGRVSQIDASAFDSASAYVAVKRPLLDDPAPYVFRTHDYGRTWAKVVAGIPSSDYVHVVREDPVRRGLLYAGTQHGFFISYDDGDRWTPLSLNLPDVQISDLVVEANSIAIATHGRGFYVLDDIGPLRQMGAAVTTAPDAWLFAPAEAIRSAGGATITYWLKHPAKNLTIEILESAGRVVQTIRGAVPGAAGRGGGGRGGGAGGSGSQPPAQGDEGAAPQGGRGRGGPPTASMAAGVNRVTWNLDYPGPVTFPGMVLWGATTTGPAALPGTYQVRLTVDGRAMMQPLVVAKHPRFADVTDADLKEQFDLASRIRDAASEANEAVIQIRALEQQVADRLGRSQDAALKTSADRLTARLNAIEEEIYQVRNQSNQDPLNFPIKINNRIASLLRVVNAGDGKPLASVYPIFTDLTAELKVQTDRLKGVLATEVPATNAELRRLGLQPLDPAARAAQGTR
jgi:photosystem II stability/assembly factor-like uncharacterized protein